MKQFIRWFAVISILSICAWGACHSSQVKRFTANKDGPACIPFQDCK